MMDDEDLVRRCLEGNIGAFETLVERYREPLTRFCLRQSGDHDTAEDLAQEAFLGAYLDLHALRVPAKFGAWLFRLAFRLGQSWRRRRHDCALPTEAMDRFTTCGSAADALARSEARLLVEDALALLPAAQRQAVTLKYLDGYTTAELAMLLEVPVETIRTRLRRARERLQQAGVSMPEAPRGEREMKRREFLKQTAGVAGAAALGSGAAAAPGAPGAGPRFARRVLEKLDLVQMESGLTWPLYACLRALNGGQSLSYLMGMTGMAFQFAVSDTIADTGPTDVMDWHAWFTALRRTGCSVTVFDARRRSFLPGLRVQTEEEYRACQAAAWDAVRASLDRGVPAIAWMPITPEQKAQGKGCEYALIVGYDTEAGLYHVRVPGRAMWTIPWDGFGRADPVNWFNVIVIGEGEPGEAREREREALAFAVAHARSTHPGHGLGAFETWHAALEAGHLPVDRCPRAARWQREARAHAAAFLREIMGHSPASTRDLAESAASYDQVARAWETYVALYSGPAAGAAAAQARQRSARQALDAAAAAEEAAVAALERALAAMAAT